MKTPYLLILFFFTLSPLFSQTNSSPCSNQAILERHIVDNPNAEMELWETQQALIKLSRELKSTSSDRSVSTYTIPVVMHVFHFGDDGKMDMDQILSGLEILNQDFNGLNDGWNTIDPAFDSIKGALDINFCLATIDPQGNPTTGVVYHEDQQALLNEGNLFQHAWDNYKYLNIYFPKYTSGEPSNFTAYAYYPSTSRTNANIDGIFYSSIRWGYGNHSELDPGDDWASVCSHEAGHWLNLRHTFESGCIGMGDFVDDTPPTLGGTIELAGCNNNDNSCGVPTNGENFMDYNHRCKKMFTQGQVDLMTTALFLPSRGKLWSDENLIATGCAPLSSSIEGAFTERKLLVYPNPADKVIYFKNASPSMEIQIFNTHGQLLAQDLNTDKEHSLDVSNLIDGVYFFSVIDGSEVQTGRIIISH